MAAVSASRVLVLVLLLAPAGCTTSPHRSPARTSASSTVTPAPPLTAQRAAQISQALAAGSADQLSQGVSIPAGTTLDNDAVAKLKALGPVTFDVGTFTDLGNGTASVQALAGGKPWTAYLVRVAGQWKLSATGGQP